MTGQSIGEISDNYPTYVQPLQECRVLKSPNKKVMLSLWWPGSVMRLHQMVWLSAFGLWSTPLNWCWLSATQMTVKWGHDWGWTMWRYPDSHALSHLCTCSQIRQIQPDDYMESLLQKGCPLTGGSTGHWIWCSRRTDGLSMGFHFQIPGLSVRWRLVLAFVTNACHACTVSLYCWESMETGPEPSWRFVLGVSHAIGNTKSQKDS